MRIPEPMSTTELRRREMLLLLGCSVGLRAQDVTFSTGVKVVNVLASVRDKQGRYVQNLTQADFELREDGRLQQIRYFSRQTDLALTLGLLVDTSMSQRLVLEQERNAGRNFLWQVLRPDKDSAFVIRFDIEVELTQDSTDSLPQLDKALDSLEMPAGGGIFRTSRRGSRSRGGQGRVVFGGIGTLLYDAVFLASDEVLGKLEGRKAIVLLSDGVDAGSRTPLDRAVETTQKADTSVYAIRMSQDSDRRGSNPLDILLPGGGAARRQQSTGERALRRIAEETGGRYFEVTESKPLDDVFQEIEEELRNQYNLGYVSDRQAASGEFRKIEVAAKRRGLAVQARNGYYAQP